MDNDNAVLSVDKPRRLGFVKVTGSAYSFLSPK